jgi:transcriptional regulator with XRE-family HTH domain
MASEFAIYLEDALAAKGLSQREFARLVKYPVQSLNQILKGTRLPPPKRLDAWAAALKGAVDPERFRLLGLLEHCPDEVKEFVLKTLQ